MKQAVIFLCSVVFLLSCDTRDPIDYLDYADTPDYTVCIDGGCVDVLCRGRGACPTPRDTLRLIEATVCKWRENGIDLAPHIDGKLIVFASEPHIDDNGKFVAHPWTGTRAYGAYYSAQRVIVVSTGVPDDSGAPPGLGPGLLAYELGHAYTTREFPAASEGWRLQWRKARGLLGACPITW